MGILFASLIVLIDQYTKAVSLQRNNSVHINHGIALGLFSGSVIARVLYSGTWLVIALLIWLNGYGDLPFGLVFGGTISNLIDYIRKRGIVDWIELKFLGASKSNLADIAVAIGLLLVFVRIV